MQICLFKLKFLLLLFFLNYCNKALAAVCPSNTTISFYIENSKTVEGTLIEKFETQLLSECAERCSIHPNCYGANFLLTTDDIPTCLLLDTRKKGNDAETPASEAVIYSIKPYCRSKSSSEDDVCAGRAWTFERYPNVKVTDSKFAFIEKKTFNLDQCLSECASRKNCEAVEFSQSSSSCRLLSISLQSVHSIWKFFGLSQEKIDIYERNCQNRMSSSWAPMTSEKYDIFSGHLEFSKCTFLRLNQAGFTDVFDIRLDTVADKQTCERICISWHQGTCRSYTYDRKLQRCYLSHTAPRLFGRRPLDNLNEDLAFGELDDCMHFSLNCKSDSLTLSGKSMKMFDGAFKARKGTHVMCQKNVTSAYEFDAEMKYGECGVEKSQTKPSPSFIGTILVKEGSTDMITIKDKMIQVKCRMHDETQPLATQYLAFQLEVGDKNDSRKNILSDIASRAELPITKKARKQKYRLEVMSDDGTVANVVNVGGKGHLLITVDKDSKLSENDFVISELTAEDSITKKRMHLIDSNGCVSNNSIVTSLFKPTPRQLQINIKFMGFTDQAQVVYHAIAKPCKTGCIPKCNLPYYINGNSMSSVKKATLEGDEKEVYRHKRASSIVTPSSTIIDLDEPRTFDLEEDIYPVKTRNGIIVIDGRVKDETIQKLHSAVNSATINFADVVKLLEKIKLSKKEELNYDLKEAPKDEAFNTMRCLTDDLSCALTILLASIQLIFLITCIFVIYLYVRQWIKRVLSSPREPIYSNYSLSSSSISDEQETEEIKQ